MTDWTDNHKMTTDRKDGQSENYGFTLVINTPPPVIIRVRKNRWRLWGSESINNINMKYIFISFTLLAMIAASILKVLNYINCSWWVIT